jgi:hypothetical protein
MPFKLFKFPVFTSKNCGAFPNEIECVDEPIGDFFALTMRKGKRRKTLRLGVNVWVLSRLEVLQSSGRHGCEAKKSNFSSS